MHKYKGGSDMFPRFIKYWSKRKHKPIPLLRKAKPTANVNKVTKLNTTQNCATQFRVVAPPMTWEYR